MKERLFFVDQQQLADYLSRSTRHNYIVTDYRRGWRYYPATSKGHAAKILMEIVEDSHKDAMETEWNPAVKDSMLLASSIEVATREDFVLAEIGSNGKIEYDEDGQPDAAYFVAVLRAAKESL